jgi:hypothetical protein
MAWWGWALLAFALFRLKHWSRAGYCGTWRHRGRMHGWGPNVIVIDGRRGCGRREWRDFDHRPEQPAEPPAPLSAAQKREREVAELRRRYVADDITVEEYERELDRILREPVPN